MKNHTLSRRQFLATTLLALASEAFAKNTVSPFAIYISKGSGALVLTHQGEAIITGPVSFGDDKTPTPVGNYRVQGKDPHYWSRTLFNKTGKKFIMADCLLLEGLDNNPEQDGCFIHQGNTLGKSHGCFRLPRWLAMVLFRTVPEGTPVFVSGAFPKKLEDQNHVHTNIWVKKSRPALWQAESNPAVSKVIYHLNGGVNQGGIDPDYPIDLNGLALVLGGQVFADKMFESGGQLEGIDGAIVRHLSTVAANKTAVRRYTNPFTLKEGFLFDGYADGEHFFLWWSKDHVDAFIDKVNEHQRARGADRTLRHIPPLPAKK